MPPSPPTPGSSAGPTPATRDWHQSWSLAGLRAPAAPTAAPGAVPYPSLGDQSLISQGRTQRSGPGAVSLVDPGRKKPQSPGGQAASCTGVLGATPSTRSHQSCRGCAPLLAFTTATGVAPARHSFPPSPILTDELLFKSGRAKRTNKTSYPTAATSVPSQELRAHPHAGAGASTHAPEGWETAWCTMPAPVLASASPDLATWPRCRCPRAQQLATAGVGSMGGGHGTGTHTAPDTQAGARTQDVSPQSLHRARIIQAQKQTQLKGKFQPPSALRTSEPLPETLSQAGPRSPRPGRGFGHHSDVGRRAPSPRCPQHRGALPHLAAEHLLLLLLRGKLEQCGTLLPAPEGTARAARLPQDNAGGSRVRGEHSEPGAKPRAEPPAPAPHKQDAAPHLTGAAGLWQPERAARSPLPTTAHPRAQATQQRHELDPCLLGVRVSSTSSPRSGPQPSPRRGAAHRCISQAFPSHLRTGSFFMFS